jgi:hypothetical protein
MSDADTVQVRVTGPTPVTGRGAIRHLASVAIDMDDVELTTHGWTLRESRLDKLTLSACPAPSRFVLAPPCDPNIRATSAAPKSISE